MIPNNMNRGAPTRVARSMTHAPPVPAANQSPYPLQEPPHPPAPPRAPEPPKVQAGRSPAPWLALLGAGVIAIVGGTLLLRRR